MLTKDISCKVTHTLCYLYNIWTFVKTMLCISCGWMYLWSTYMNWWKPNPGYWVMAKWWKKRETEVFPIWLHLHLRRNRGQRGGGCRGRHQGGNIKERKTLFVKIRKWAYRENTKSYVLNWPKAIRLQIDLSRLQWIPVVESRQVLALAAHILKLEQK